MHLPHHSAFDKSPVVFLTACTHQRRALLANPAAHAILLDVWRRSAELNGWVVGQYVLMPDHIHLFASPAREACPLAKWVQLWKAIAAKGINRALGHQGTLWQADYFDRYLRSLRDYEQKWGYVELNPVRQQLVVDHRQWPYRGVIHDLRYRKARDS